MDSLGAGRLSPCTGIACLFCIAVSCLVMVQLSRGDVVTVDVYETSLNIMQVRDESRGNVSNLSAVGSEMIRAGSRKEWRDVVCRSRPVVVDLWHEGSVFTPVVLIVVAVMVFVLMTVRMESESEAGSTGGPYSEHNRAVSGSSTVVLWTAIFVAGVGAAHALFVQLILGPSSVERLVLAWLLLFAPLARMCQPTDDKRHGGGGQYSMMLGVAGYDDDDGGGADGGGGGRRIPACGVHPSLASVVSFCVAVGLAAAHIEYDPHSYRAELLSVVAAVDLLVLGLGHLWDTPPSVRTVVNCRVFYCCAVLCIVAAVLSEHADEGGFAVEFIDVES